MKLPQSLIKAAEKVLQTPDIPQIITEAHSTKLSGVCRTCKTEMTLTIPDAQRSLNTLEDVECPWCLQGKFKLQRA